MMSSKNKVTAKDIERYHSGKMSAEERHMLEKAALDDPFLADALEGYAFTSSAAADLAKIQSRLDAKRGGKKIIPLFQKYKWLSVAAIAIVIAGAGWLALSIPGQDNKSVAIRNKKNQSADDSLLFLRRVKIQKDSLEAASALADRQILPTKPSESGGPERRDHSVAGKPLKKEIEEKETTGTPATPVTAQNQGKENSDGFFKADTKDVGKNNALIAEPKANRASAPYTIKRPVSNTAPLSGRNQAVSSNDTIKDLNVVLQPLPSDSASLQEVVLGYDNQKKAKAKYPQVRIDTLEPAEGYLKFDDYIANNLKMPEELKAKPLSGEVQLSFDVDEKGQPVNIAVVKSLCDKCDEEAVRLLKEGPKWKKKKNKKGKISIKF